MKNLAGSDVAIFLYRYELKGAGVDFVLNEEIAGDMQADIDKRLQPYIFACGETLLRYKHLCVGNVIMDGSLLVTGEFEVMLSRGLGKYFPEKEKARLFDDANHIATLLQDVMSRFSKAERGEEVPKAKDLKAIPDVNEALEEMGKKIRVDEDLAYSDKGMVGVKQLKPDDLPVGITTSYGYDHRGICYNFKHNKLGELGRIILMGQGDGQTLLHADLSCRQENIDSLNSQKKKEMFEEVVEVVTLGIKSI